MKLVKINLFTLAHTLLFLLECKGRFLHKELFYHAPLGPLIIYTIDFFYKIWTYEVTELHDRHAFFQLHSDNFFPRESFKSFKNGHKNLIKISCNSFFELNTSCNEEEIIEMNSLTRVRVRTKIKHFITQRFIGLLVFPAAQQ